MVVYLPLHEKNTWKEKEKQASGGVKKSGSINM